MLKYGEKRSARFLLIVPCGKSAALPYAAQGHSTMKSKLAHTHCHSSKYGSERGVSGQFLTSIAWKN
jgi:hypothetical protein